MKTLTYAATLLAITLICFVGCGGESSSSKNRLVGKWKLDKELLREIMQQEMAKQAEGAGGAANAGMKKMMESMMEETLKSIEMTMEFKSDGTFKMVATVPNMVNGKLEQKTEEKNGTWKITKTEGDILTVSSTEKDGPAKIATITFKDDDTIEITGDEMDMGKMPPGAKIRFNRAK
jgi:hypothetical protein